MSIAEIAVRYSQALFNLESSLEGREKLLDDLEKFLIALKPCSKCFIFFSSPIINLERKEEIIKKILRDYPNEKLIAFLCTLLAKRRFRYLAEIVEEFRKKVNEERKVQDARLITAVPVEEAIKSELVRKLEKKYQKRILIKEEVNPQLIGGGILIVGNEMIDFSVRNRLENLKEDLSAVTV